MNGTVYLLCFAPGIPRDARTNVRHYLGWTANDPEYRLEQHVTGAGSPLVRAAVNAGLTVRIARTWTQKDRNFERALKNRRNAPALCPNCNRR